MSHLSAVATASGRSGVCVLGLFTHFTGNADDTVVTGRYIDVPTKASLQLCSRLATFSERATPGIEKAEKKRLL